MLQLLFPTLLKVSFLTHPSFFSATHFSSSSSIYSTFPCPTLATQHGCLAETLSINYKKWERKRERRETFVCCDSVFYRVVIWVHWGLCLGQFCTSCTKWQAGWGNEFTGTCMIIVTMMLIYIDVLYCYSWLKTRYTFWTNVSGIGFQWCPPFHSWSWSCFVSSKSCISLSLATRQEYHSGVFFYIKKHTYTYSSFNEIYLFYYHFFTLIFLQWQL